MAAYISDIYALWAEENPVQPVPDLSSKAKNYKKTTQPHKSSCVAKMESVPEKSTPISGFRTLL